MSGPTRALATLACLLLVACGDDDGSFTPDAGPLLDAGPGTDAAFAPDASAAIDAGSDAGTPDMGPPPPPVPEDIFFIGNSFTLGGPIPNLVHDLAVSAGFPEPNVGYRAVGGQSLEWHRADTSAEGAPGRVAEGWDVLVLQEYSTGPTDAIGDPMQFKEDATWFHDLAREVRPDCRVILYESWARRSSHSFYPGTFDDPGDMQAQLRFHYFDAAESFIPAMAMTTPNVTVAPAGDAWERQLAGGEPPRLHASDDYHAGAAGQYLNALVIYSTIYGTSARGLVPIGVDAAVARTLQETADATTGETRLPPGLGDPTFEVGHTVRVDVGPTDSGEWPALLTANGAAGPLTSDEGTSTTAVASASGFDGTQTGGVNANDLGWPAAVSSDSLWVGSFDGHVAALDRRATVVLRGLPAGTYSLTLYASRVGDDSGNGRSTRYTVGARTVDLEASDNTGTTVELSGLVPDELGELVLEVTVSPDGLARFGYLGAFELTRES